MKMKSKILSLALALVLVVTGVAVVAANNALGYIPITPTCGGCCAQLVEMCPNCWSSLVDCSCCCAFGPWCPH